MWSAKRDTPGLRSLPRLRTLRRLAKTNRGLRASRLPPATFLSPLRGEDAPSILQKISDGVVRCRFSPFRID